VHLGSVLLQHENVQRYSERTQQRCGIDCHHGLLQILNPITGCNQAKHPYAKKKKKSFLFFGNEFSFSDYYLKTYFKKERNEREIEKEKKKECKNK
jgi:hypothetical protein